MAHSKKTNTQVSHDGMPSEAEVLYQKMGNRWFAFSMVNDEVYVGSISQEEIDALEIDPSAAKTFNTTLKSA